MILLNSWWLSCSDDNYLQDNLLIEMENEGMGAQGLSAVDKKITIALGEASSLPTLTHVSNSLKLPRAFYRTLRNE